MNTHKSITIAAALALGLLALLALSVGVAGAQDGYDPGYDVAPPWGEINVADIQAVASRWNTTGVYTSGHTHWGETWTGSGFGLYLNGDTPTMPILRTYNSSSGAGISGRSAGGNGVYGRTDSSNADKAGVYGYSEAGTGGYFESVSGTALRVAGQAEIAGNLTLDGSINEALRLEPTALSPNLIGGYSGNSVTSGVIGATIGGGGTSGDANRVTDDYGTVGGGLGNQAGNGDTNLANSFYTTISGGHQNTASGKFATVGGGHSNTASNEGATVGGGGFNTADGFHATIGGGYQNTASGSRSTIPGGSENTALGKFSLAAGAQAQASLYGQMAFASGQFASVGDAQTSVYVLRNTTTSDTPKELFLDGSSERLTIGSDRTVTFDILVAARSDGGASAGYRIRGVIENTGGNTGFVGTPTVETLGEEVASWDVAVQADDANDALVVQVTGAADTMIRWVATARTAEVAW